VVATHDPAVVDACDRHYVLDEGRLTDHVAPVDLSHFAHPERRLVEEATPPHFDEAPPVADAEPVETPYAGRRVAPAPERAPDALADPDAVFRRPPADGGS
jgi:putative ABC transport system ATP-binding protein